MSPEPQWWKISAWNEQAQWGWGTEKQAQEWADRANRTQIEADPHSGNVDLVTICPATEAESAWLDGCNEGFDFASELTS